MRCDESLWRRVGRNNLSLLLFSRLQLHMFNDLNFNQRSTYPKSALYSRKPFVFWCYLNKQNKDFGRNNEKMITKQ